MSLYSSKSVQIRAITFIGAGATILAVIGYLLMKSDRKKPKKKSPKLASLNENLDLKSDLTETNNNQDASFINNNTDNNNNQLTEIELNEPTDTDCSSPKQAIEFLLCNRNLKSDDESNPEVDSPNIDIINADQELNTVIGDSDQRENLDNHELSQEKSSDNEEEKNQVNQQQQNLSQQQQIDSDKLSETSSDSGNGLSEMYLNNDCEAEDCLNEIEEEDHVIINNKVESQISQDNKTSDETATSKKTEQSLIIKSSSSSSISQSPKMSTSKSSSAVSSLSIKLSKSKQLTASKTFHTSDDLNKANSKKQKDRSSSKSSENPEDLVVYEFNFPRVYCGKLIGKNGVHVDYIRSKTQTQIAVRNDPKVEEQQIVCVSGRLDDVDRALEIIGQRFPAKQYPDISFKPISKPILYRRYNPDKVDLCNEPKIFVAPNMFVDLNGVIDQTSASFNNKITDLLNLKISVNVTAVVSTSHVFIQLPTNPTYEHLQTLDENMLKSYSSVDEPIPFMVEPIEYGTICAAPTSYGWHRAMVTNYQSIEDIVKNVPDYKETCGLATLKFLDYGGYLTIPTNQLRQLRSDFMLLPFQAVECYLDNILPFEGYEEEGKGYLSQIIKGTRLQVIVNGYAEDGVPLIKLFRSNDPYEDYNINNELVNKGFAYYLDNLIVNNNVNLNEYNSNNQISTEPTN